MGDAGRPPASSSKGAKGNPNIQLNRTALLRQSSIRRGQKNLLPTRYSAGSTETTLAATNGASALPPVRLNRTSHSPGPSSSGGRGCRPPMSKQQLLDAQYGLYLQNFLEVALLKEMEEIETMCKMDDTASSCVKIAEMGTGMNRMYAQRKITVLDSKIKFLDKFRPTFGILTEFAGHTALAEIQALLIEKHEKLLLNMGSVEEPLFRESELDEILKSLRKEQPLKVERKQDRDRVIEFACAYVEKLRTLTTNSETAASKLELLVEASEDLLAQASLLASEIEMKKHDKGKPDPLCMFQKGSQVAAETQQTQNSGGKMTRNSAAAPMEDTTTLVSSDTVNHGSFGEAENGSPLTPKDPLQLSFLV